MDTGSLGIPKPYNLLVPQPTKTVNSVSAGKSSCISRVLSGGKGIGILRVTRGFTLFRSVVEVFDEKEVLIGRFRQRMLSIGGKFEVQDTMGQTLCMLKGKWSSWEFNFTQGNFALAKVSKKWAGLGRELFTSADNYMLEITETVQPNDKVRMLIMAAVMCIDMVLKE